MIKGYTAKRNAAMAAKSRTTTALAAALRRPGGHITSLRLTAFLLSA